MRYLDPKADLVFWKIFSKHKDLLISLINALLPLNDDEMVESVEYLPSELVPMLPTGKYSIINVQCKDVKGCQFIVMIGVVWYPALLLRVAFNASMVYVRQSRRKRKYEFQQPVYLLNLVNKSFINDNPSEYIHNYNMVHELHSDKIIEGLHLTFVELPKFKPHTQSERKMAVLWLRFLTEINEDTTTVPEELLANPETSKALKEVEESAFTEEEMEVYDHFWDMLGADRLLFVDSNNISRKKGREEGLAEGLAEGRKEGLAEGELKGMAKERNKVARAMLDKGMEVSVIAELTGLDEDAIRSLSV